MKSIGTIGFTLVEKQLLIKQIKIVSAKIHAGWEYIGEAKNADVVLSKQKLDVPTSTRLVLVGDIQNTGDHAVIESPIRLMQLTHVLEENAEERFSNAQFILGLFSSKKIDSFCMDVERDKVYFYPWLSRIGGDFSSQEELVQLLYSGELVEAKIRSNATNIDVSQLKLSSNVKRVVWHVAKLEKDFSSSRYADRKKYKISVWPRVNSWDKCLTQSRLAAAFSRRFISPEQAARLSGASVGDAKGFLHCCESNGIAVLADNALAKDQMQVTHVVQDVKSMGWLKKQINRFMGNGN